MKLRKSPRHTIRPLARSIALSLTASLAIVCGARFGFQSVDAATYYWDSASGTWLNGINWSDDPAGGGNVGTVPTAADIAWFNQTSVNGAEVVQLDGDGSVLGLVFANTGTTLLDSDSTTVRTLTLGTSGITINSGAGAVTLGNATNIMNLVLAGAQSWTNNSSNTLTVVGAIANGGNLLTVAGTGNTTISGVVSGTGALAMSGAGTLTLSATNTFSGGLTISAGTVSISANTQLGGAAGTAGAVTLNGGTLKMTAAVATTNTHVITVGAGGGTINVTTTGQYFFNTANTLLGSGALTLTGNGTLTANTGNLRVAQTNTYSGAVTINSGGILEYGVAGALASTSYTIGNQGEFALNSGLTLANTVGITVSGGTNSVISFENGTAGNYASSITLNANAIIGLRDWFAYATVRGGTISGNISGVGGLTVNSGTGSGGLLTLSGTNSYSGTTTINSSVVQFTKEVSLYNNTSSSWTAANIIVGSGSTVAFNVGGTGEFTTNDVTTLLTNIDRAVNNNGFQAGSKIAFDTTNAAGGTFTIATAIADTTGTGGGAVALTKQGGNTLVLGGANTFTGATTLTAGTLSVSDTTNLGGATANNNVVFNGGTLQVTGTTMTSFGSHTRTYNAGVTVGFDINNAANNFSPGTTAFVATNTLLKTGAGTLTLGAASNTIKTLQLNQGTLDIGANNLTISNAGGTTINNATTNNVTINATGGGKLVLSQNSATDGPDIGAANGGTLTINANITGTSSFENWTGTANGTGVTVLTGQNDYTNNTIINTGVLSVSNIGNSGSTTSNLGQGTTINISSVSAGNNQNSTLRYTGTGETTNRVINFFLAGNNTGGIIEQSGTSGLLKFSSNQTSTGTGTKTLTLQGSTAGTGEFAGNIVNGSGTIAVTKAGTGTWTLSGAANTYTGATSINGGTLVLGSTGNLGATAVTVSNAGSTFAIKQTASATSNALTGSLSLAAGTTFTMTDGFTSTFNVTGASTLAPASGAATALNLEIGAGSGASDKLAITGAATIGAGGAVLNISAAAAPSSSANTYTLITAASGLNTNITLAGVTNYNIGGSIFHLTLSTSTATSEIASFVAGSASAPTAFWTGSQSSSWATQDGTTFNANFAVDAVGTGNTLVLPDANTNVTFTANSATNLSTTLDQAFTINSLTFSGTGTSNTAGSTIAPGTGGATSTLTINAAALNGNVSGTGITVASGSGANTISANVVLGASQTWTNNSTNAFTVSGNISGSGFGITKTGTGPLILSGTNTETGATAISAGTLQFNGTAAMSGSSAITVANGVTLSLNSDAANPTFTPGGNTVLSGGATFNVGNISSGTSQTITLGGTTQFNGSNTLNVTSSNGYQLTLSAVTHNGVFPTYSTAAGTTLNIGTITNNGGTYSSSTFAGAGTINVTGAITNAQANRSFGLTFNQTGTVTLSGNNNLRNNNNSSDNANTYVIVNNGTTNFNSTNAINTTSGSNTNYTDANGVAISNGNSNVVYLNQANTATPTIDNTSGGAISLAGQYFVDIHGSFIFGGTNNLTLTPITYTGQAGTANAGVYLTSTTSPTITTNGSATLTIAGIIAGGTTSGTTDGIIKAGAGTLALTGANTFSGGLTIKAGTLIQGGLATSALGTGTITLGDGATSASATLSGAGSAAIANANAITIASGGSGTYTIADTVASDYNFSGAVALNNAATFKVTGAGQLQFTNAITGSSLITIDGGGTATKFVKLSGDSSSTFTGNVLIQNGNAGLSGLKFGNANALSVANTVTMDSTSAIDNGGLNVSIAGLNDVVTGAGGSKVLLATAGTNFTLGGSGTYSFSGVISNAGNVVKSGAGTQTLAGTNSYTGSTTVNGGTLLVSGSISGSSTAVNSGGTLGGAGGTTGVVNVNSGGTLSPGAGGIGTLNAASNVALNDGSTFKLEINTGVATTDLLAVQGGLNLSGTVTLSISDLSPAAISSGTFAFTTYTGAWNGGLFTYGGNALAEGASLTVGSNQFTIDYAYNGNSVALLAVPEPNSLASLGAGFGALLGLQRFRRRRV